MRSVALLALVSAVSAGHLSVPFSRQSFDNGHARRAALRKRQDDAEPFALEALNNITGGGYYSEFEIGTPPQQISFLLDTGSSDTWVNSVEADLCNDEELQTYNGFCQTQCKYFPLPLLTSESHFDPDESSTFETVNGEDFDIQYLDSRRIQGEYFKDTVTFGDVEVTGQRMGLALQSVRPTGIMGLGLSVNVASTREYPTIIDNLVDQGHINTRAYSLYLNDIDTDAGALLFGGIDQKKFIGNLATLPLQSDALAGTSQITSFNVEIQGFDVVSPDGEKTVNIPNLDSLAILDSGSTISLLPNDQVQDLWDEFGVLSFIDVLAPFIDCAYRGDKGQGYKFEFRFDGKTISVPMDEMVIDAYSDVQDIFKSDPTLRQYFGDWDGACMFGIGSTSDFGIDDDQFTLLGATFLRSAYVVYDLANEQLGIAQANLNSTDTDIVDIEEGDLPDVTGVESQSTPTPTPSASTTSTEATTTMTATEEPTATETDGGDNGDDQADDSTDKEDNDDAGVRLIPSLLAAGALSALMLVL
ncbi:aspartic peptidase domain-containing protein [Emericellopsis atlantica]|uniref:Aspartic peptidase domain-containing protein n=1 Tax=Emericellopsis atlantica TaxID=2614577 RepID=A0A9P7ZVI1_9HYPO|nr:aspartic peptidase domain-containing protein [Emericellopsis atlantica]KAG9258591.1 aspartic peptidase domain-containing protein [Emericellopsis atlantica]